MAPLPHLRPDPLCYENPFVLPCGQGNPFFCPRALTPFGTNKHTPFFDCNCKMARYGTPTPQPT